MHLKLKKTVINNLINAFVTADIPLEKIDKLQNLRENCNEGGFIPKSDTLRHGKFLFDLPQLVASNSAAYMKKCYRDVLKPLMPRLIHLPYLAHIINLIGLVYFLFNLSY